jgi:hypothetical protein
MQKSVMRVRGSFGLKFPAEVKEKGSARIETDSSTTARVEVADTLNRRGLDWVVPTALAQIREIKIVTTAKTSIAKCGRQEKARSLIGGRSIGSVVCSGH